MVERLRKSSIFGLSLLLAATSAQAGVPSSFTVQGRLFEPDGRAPLAETVSLRFAIFAKTGATECLLYEEQHTGVNLAGTDGVFALDVGSDPGVTPNRRVTPDRDPGLTMVQVFANNGAVLFAPGTDHCEDGFTATAGAARYLRVTVVRDGGQEVVLTPDQTIGSVPQSQVAQTLQGKGPSAFLEIGALDGKLTLANLNQLLEGTQDASSLHHHDSRYIPLGSNSDKNLGGGVTYTDSGRMGLGVSNPDGRLEVRTASATQAGVVIARSGTTQTASLLEIRNEAGTALLRVDGSGKLFLPNSTPIDSLEAASKGYVDAQLLTREMPLTFAAPLVRSSGTASVSMTRATGTVDGYLAADDFFKFSQGQKLQGNAVSSESPAPNSVLAWDDGTDTWKPTLMSASQWTTSGQDIYFGQFAGNGNVGINTATPQEALEVSGNIAATGNLILGSSQSWLGFSEDESLTRISGSNSGLQIRSPQSSPLSLAWSSGGVANEKFRFTASGKLGVGTQTPSAWLELPASSASAGTAPLKLARSTTLLTTPEEGAIEFDGDSLFYTDTAGTRWKLSNTTIGATTYFPTLEADQLQTDGLEVTTSSFSVGSSHLVVSGTGNVGVGTTSPAASFEVLGSARFSNTLSTSPQMGYFEFGSVTADGMQSLSHSSADGGFRVLASRGSTSSPCTVFGQASSGGVDCGGTSGQIALTSSGLALQGFAVGGYAPTTGTRESLFIGTGNSPAATGYGVAGTVDLGTASFQAGAFSGARPSMRYTAKSHEFRTDAGDGSGNSGTAQLAVTSAGVGVGTTSPDAKLQVVAPEIHFDSAGGTQLQIRDTSSGTATQSLQFKRGSTTAASISNNASDQLSLFTNSNDILFETGAGSERMRLSASGNLGIGTSSPSSRLHVNQRFGSSSQVSTVLSLENGSGTAGAAGVGAGMEFRALNGSGDSVALASIDSILTQVTAGDERASLVLKTRNGGSTPVERARITDQGFLGLGTSSPQARLDVHGSARIHDQTPTTGSTRLTVAAGAGQGATELMALLDGNGATRTRLKADQMEFVTAGSVKFTDSTFSSQVGTSTAVLTMAGTSSAGLGLQSSNHISFAPGGSTERARLTVDGRLGLGGSSGISNPQALLHLEGSTTVNPLRIVDGFQAEGKVLTSDNLGNVRWATPASGSGGGVTTLNASAPLSGSIAGSILTLDIDQVDGSKPGYLSADDYTTFQAKQRPGNYLINASGDVSTDLVGYVSNPSSLDFGKANLTVQRIQGRAVAATAPASGEVLKWNGTSWAPAADGLGGSQWTSGGGGVISYSGGNVGLGTASPNQQLSLTGNLELSSSSRIYSGSDSLLHHSGTHNFYAGVNSGNFSTSGTGLNTGVGSMSLNSITTGSANTALGYGSLQNVTTGSANTAVGRSALVTTTGSSNTAVGSQALSLLESSSGNTAVGADAFASLTTGSQNTALGFEAGSSNTGSGNVFLGYQAGKTSTSSNKLIIANRSTSNLLVGDFDADSAKGRVGLGLGSSDAPTATLHVDGTVRLKIGTPQANQFLTTDANGNASWASLPSFGTVSSVTASAPLTVANGSTTPTLSMAQATGSVSGWLSSADWNTFNNKLSTSLSSGQIWVGNGAGTSVATARAVTGDASLSNTGVLTLKSVGTAGTYLKVTTDPQGRVSSGSATLDASDLPSMTGDVDGLYNLTEVIALQTFPLDLSTAPTTGQVLSWDGSAWKAATSTPSQWSSVNSSTITLGGAYTKVGLGTSSPASQLELSQDLGLATTSSSSVGLIKQNGFSLLHTYSNTGVASGNRRSNLFVGYEAGNMSSTTAASWANTGAGGRTLASVTTGGQNTALGYESLNALTTASGNTALGSRSGKALTSGAYNTLQGYLSGTALVSGADNVGVGANALLNATSSSSNVAVGFNALKDVTTSNSNTAVGYQALSGVTSGSNTAIGYEAGKDSTGSGNVFIGSGAGGGVSTSNSLYISSNSTTLIYGDFNAGRVGIGTTTPTAKFQVGIQSDGSVAVANSWTGFSDARLKKNFSLMEGSLEEVLKLSGYRYYWKEGKDRSRQIGVIAQEVQKVFPEAVHETTDGILTVDYGKLVAPLIESVKSLFGKLQRTDARVERLEAENAALQARLDRLEKALDAQRVPASAQKNK